MARALLPDDLWTEIAPHLPPACPCPKGGWRRIKNRSSLTGILFVLRLSVPGGMLLAEMGCGCGMNYWRRLREWQAAGVWAHLHQVLLERKHGVGESDCRRASVDSVSVRTKKSFATGQNPTDRGRAGQSRHLITDARGTPLDVCLSGANRPDSVMIAPLSMPSRP